MHSPAPTSESGGSHTCTNTMSVSGSSNDIDSALYAISSLYSSGFHCSTHPMSCRLAKARCLAQRSRVAPLKLASLLRTMGAAHAWTIHKTLVNKQQ